MGKITAATDKVALTKCYREFVKHDFMNLSFQQAFWFYRLIVDSKNAGIGTLEELAKVFAEARSEFLEELKKHLKLDLKDTNG